MAIGGRSESKISPGLVRVPGWAKAGDVAQLESEFRRLSHRDLVMHLPPATRAAVGAFESVAPLRLQALRGPSGIALDAVAVPHTHVAALAIAAGRAERREPRPEERRVGKVCVSSCR